MKLAIKIFMWTLLSVVLLAVGSLLATVKLLKPERLTPMVETVANRMLNADVSVDRVQLIMQKTSPFLNLEVSSLTILSRDMLQLPAQARDTLPSWADTLCSVGSIRAGINIFRLVKGDIHLNDVQISRLQANALIVNDSLTNFNIYVSEEDNDTTELEIPNFRIKSFSILEPMPIRYADMSTGTSLTAYLDTASIHSSKEKTPVYSLSIDTNMESQLLDMLRDNSLQFKLNGIIDWKHDHPLELALKDFEWGANAINGSFSTALDFNDQFMVNTLDFRLNPLSFNDVVSMLPDSVARAYGIPEGIDTDLAFSLGFSLQQPYDAMSGEIPYALLTFDLPQSYLKWKQVDLRQIAVNTDVQLNGPDLNDATVKVNTFTLGGPATTIDLKASLANLLSDPRFDATINGEILLGKLPKQLTDLLEGTKVNGKITMDAQIKGTQSMLSRDGFHLLKVNGGIDAENLYYFSPDTLTMAYARNAALRFGTSTSIATPRGTIDSLLTASVTIDTAKLVASDTDIRLKNFKIGAGALNSSSKNDTTAIIPFGGRLTLGRMSMVMLEDSMGVRMRDLSGTVSLQRYKGDAHLPLLRFDAALGRLSAGDNSSRFMVDNATMNTRLYKLPLDQMSKSRQAFSKLADSLHRAMPDLPRDSVFARAMALSREKNARSGQGRMHQQQMMSLTDSIEIYDWGISSGIKRLLVDWDLSGSLTAKKARLFTTVFPLRNSVNNFNIRFNNDSILLRNIEYKAGHSDFLISGNVSNMKKAFTSRMPQNLKIDFDMQSDTIDVNELAYAFFTGAANTGVELSSDIDNDESMEMILSEDTGEMGPFLIPINIEANFTMRANNVLYSDFLLHDFKGRAMAYDGALNLSNLSASSQVGSINLSALYSAPTVNDMKFGFGMNLQDFNISNFLQLVPAMDSIMPLMRDMAGIIRADIAATADVDSEMNLLIPSLSAAISLEGDSLTLLDPETFKTVSKWLLFKDKNKNSIDHMEVKLIVENNTMQLYPFVFDFDRYRLGIQGYNDLDMNFNYHVAILKSPLPFKFGLNVSGNTDKYKVRLGRARFNEQEAVKEVAIVDTTRVNLINQLENVFRRGVRNSRFAELKVSQRPSSISNIDAAADTLSSADSLLLKQEGLLD